MSGTRLLSRRGQAGVWRSFVRWSQLGKLRLYDPSQCWQMVFDMIPNAFGYHARIAMDQQVAEVDDPAQPGYPFGEFGMSLVQAVQRLTDDLELAFDRGLRPRVGSVGRAVHAFGETLDIHARPGDICQQDAGIKTHRRVRAMCR